MKSFEYRKALAEVLDDVHKQTVVKTLGKLGIEVSDEKDWLEVEKGVNHYYKKRQDSDELFSDVEYIGDDPRAYGAIVPVGPVFGEMNTLLMSGRTPYISDTFNNASLAEDKYRRRIGLFKAPFDSFPDFTSIYILRDIPPVAIYGEAIIDIISNRWERGEAVPDVEIIERAQKEHGPRGAEFISEEVARRVIYALRTDTSRTLLISDFYS